MDVINNRKLQRAKLRVYNGRWRKRAFDFVPTVIHRTTKELTEGIKEYVVALRDRRLRTVDRGTWVKPSLPSSGLVTKDVYDRMETRSLIGTNFSAFIFTEQKHGR